MEHLWQTYRLTGMIPTLKQAGRPQKPRNLRGKSDPTSLRRTSNQRLSPPENHIRRRTHTPTPHPHPRSAKNHGQSQPHPAKQTICKWVRYERANSMTLWHMDREQLTTGEWFLAITDDASQYIVAYGVCPKQPPRTP